MEKEFYWCLVFDNYHDTDHIEYFDTKEHAIAAFEEICEVCKNHEEFERWSDGCSWFDSTYNEYSTYIWLCEETMPGINNSANSLFFDKEYEKDVW